MIAAIPARLHKIAFDEDATAYELFQVVLAFSILWFVVFAIFARALGKLAYGKQWLIDACEREYERVTKKFLDDSGIAHTKEEMLATMQLDWPFMQVLAIQHGVGVALCIPSLIGYGDPDWATSLAMMGILSEMGWEIEHTIEIAYKRFFTENGKMKVPNLLLVIFFFHHSLTCCLGMPMVLRYRSLTALHWLCFDLQAGGSIMAVVEYTKMLDITKPNDLLQFKICNFVLFIFFWWTRFFHWMWLCGIIILTWYRDKNWTFMCVGTGPILLFSLLNIFFMVIPFTERFFKFLHASAEYQSLPEGAKRRQSFVNLEDTAKLLLSTNDDLADPDMAILRRLAARRKFKSVVHSVIASNRMKASFATKLASGSGKKEH